MIDRYLIENSEVLYAKDAITKVDQSDVNYFKQLSSNNLRNRVRLCTHLSPDNSLHEMIIVHGCEAYVRPHMHPGKSESTHIIEGIADVVVFDNTGGIDSIIRMGDYSSGRNFYYRMAAPIFHTLIIRSDVLVFHEVTNGPFNRKDTVFAPWAPADDDSAAVSAFMSELSEKVATII